MRRWRSWRPALRIARREALRARGRSILVLVMIGLPVLAIVALDTVARTASVSAVEGLDSRLGSADALVLDDGYAGPVDQTPDLTAVASGGGELGPTATPWTTASVRALLGPGSRLLPLYEGSVAVRTDVGVARPEALGLSASDPMAAGLRDVVSGRLPEDAGEVAVSPRLASRGFPVGATMRLQSGVRLRVVGQVEPPVDLAASLVVGDATALGLTAASGADAARRRWLVSRPDGVDWATVRRLNARGLLVLSRQVVLSPPALRRVGALQSGDRLGAAQVAVLALVVAMALLEVVLLAGPAFAVGARRQQRALALMAAGGAEPAHLRKVVLASGVVLGAAAAVAGAAGGVVLAYVAQPVVRAVSSTRLGPFEVSLRDIAAIAGVGLASALLAALLPAMLAARSDVVAVLAGRRGQTRPARWSPVLGGVLVVGGVAATGYGARQPTGGELSIAAGTIPAVVGMVLITPLVLAVLGRAAGMLPLPARFAVRDAARHRSRTAPAVAAVAATVAGVVALGIGAASDAAQSQALYAPRAPMGAGVIQVFGTETTTWSDFARVVAQQLPQARTSAVRGVPEAGSPSYRVNVGAGREAFGPERFNSWSSDLGSSLLVGRAALRGLRLPRPELARARTALARGQLVVLQPTGRAARKATVTAETFPENGNPTVVGSWTFPATVVTVRAPMQPARAVLPESVARTAGMTVRTVSLLVDGTPISRSAQAALSEAVGALDENAAFYVERGYSSATTRVVLLLLGAVGAALVLGGTLTATFLALSDARPDFATMGAVGADPRTRRSVAAAYAGTIGLVGALLGSAVGFVPGVAVTYPLTATTWLRASATTSAGQPIPDHFLVVPWLLVGGLVLLLPLAIAAVVGLGSRSRLPMVSRLS